jgi:hypothetical protein
MCLENDAPIWVPARQTDDNVVSPSRYRLAERLNATSRKESLDVRGDSFFWNAAGIGEIDAWDRH